jgi:hypothetical protein
LQESELLVTASQVAIGLAGFSGVAGVLGDRIGRAIPAVQGALLRTMIETSLLAAGFSLLPIVLLHVGCGPQGLWRLSAGINLVAFSAQFGLTLRRGMRIIRSGAPRPSMAWGVFVVSVAASIVVLLGASALGFSPSSTYVGAIFLQLALSGSTFVRFFALLTS